MARIGIIEDCRLLRHVLVKLIQDKGWTGIPFSSLKEFWRSEDTNIPILLVDMDREEGYLPIRDIFNTLSDKSMHTTVIPFFGQPKLRYRIEAMFHLGEDGCPSLEASIQGVLERNRSN